MAKWYYRIERVEGSCEGHENLIIDVLGANMNGACSHTPVLSFRWQTHYRSGHGFETWYGFHIKMVDCRSLEAMQEATRLAGRILKAPDNRAWREWAPREVLDRLDATKIRRVAYDCRLSDFVPIEELAPANLKCWIDGYRQMGAPACMVSVLAETEAEAKELIMAKLFHQGYETALALYIQSGKPVILRDSTGPEVQPLDGLLFVEGDQDTLTELSDN